MSHKAYSTPGHAPYLCQGCELSPREHDFGPWLADLPEFKGERQERRCRRCSAKQWLEAGDHINFAYGNFEPEAGCPK